MLCVIKTRRIMPARCSVPGCKSNYRDAKVYKTVYSFPKDEELRRKWCKAIGRENWTPTRYSTVCRNHFNDSDIINQVTWYDPKKGERLTAPLSQTRVKRNAVPSIFNNLCPVDPVSKRIIRPRKVNNKLSYRKMMRIVYPPSENSDSDNNCQNDLSMAVVTSPDPKPTKIHLRKMLGIFNGNQGIDQSFPKDDSQNGKTFCVPVLPEKVDQPVEITEEMCTMDANPELATKLRLNCDETIEADDADDGTRSKDDQVKYSEEIRRSGKIPTNITVKIFTALQSIICSSCDFKPVSVEVSNSKINGATEDNSCFAVYEFPERQYMSIDSTVSQISVNSSVPNLSLGNDENASLVLSSHNGTTPESSDDSSIKCVDMPLFITKDVIEHVHVIYNDIKNYEKVIVKYIVNQSEDDTCNEKGLLQITKEINFYVTFIDEDQNPHQPCICVISLMPASEFSILCTYKSNRLFRKMNKDGTVDDTAKKNFTSKRKKVVEIETLDVGKSSYQMMNVTNEIKGAGIQGKMIESVECTNDQVSSENKYNLRHCKIDFRKLVGFESSTNRNNNKSVTTDGVSSKKNKDGVIETLEKERSNDNFTGKKRGCGSSATKNKKYKKPNEICQIGSIKEDDSNNKDDDILAYHKLVNKNLISEDGKLRATTNVNKRSAGQQAFTMKELKIVLEKCDEPVDHYRSKRCKNDVEHQNIIGNNSPRSDVNHTNASDLEEETIENIKLFISNSYSDRQARTEEDTVDQSMKEMFTTCDDIKKDNSVDSINGTMNNSVEIEAMQSAPLLITDVRGNVDEHLIDSLLHEEMDSMELIEEEQLSKNEKNCADKHISASKKIAVVWDEKVDGNDKLINNEDVAVVIVNNKQIKISNNETPYNNDNMSKAMFQNDNQNDNVFQEVTVTTCEKVVDELEIPFLNFESDETKTGETSSKDYKEDRTKVADDNAVEDIEVACVNNKDDKTNEEFGKTVVNMDIPCVDYKEEKINKEIDKTTVNIEAPVVDYKENNLSLDSDKTVVNKEVACFDYEVVKTRVDKICENVGPGTDYKEDEVNAMVKKMVVNVDIPCTNCNEDEPIVVNEGTCVNMEVKSINDGEEQINVGNYTVTENAQRSMCIRVDGVYGKEVIFVDSNDVPRNVEGLIKISDIGENVRIVNRIVDEVIHGEEDIIFGYSDDVAIVEQDVEGVLELDLEEDEIDADYINNDDEVVIIKRSLDDIISDNSDVDDDCDEEIDVESVAAEDDYNDAYMRFNRKEAAVVNDEAVNDSDCKEGFLYDEEMNEIIESDKTVDINDFNTLSINTITCRICDKEITKESLRRHLKRHGGVKFCPYCSKSFSSTIDYNEHIRCHKENQGNEKYMCYICKKKFCFLKNICKHMSNAHPENTEFHDTLILLPDNGTNNKNDAFSPKERKEKKQRVMVSCNYCDQRVSTVYYKRHLLSHTGERPYKCGVCGKRFLENSTLKNHMRTHTGERPYTCDFCHKTFGHISTLTKHVNIHTGAKKYQCSVCSKYMSSSYNLKLHARIHTGEKPFGCDWCDKKFTAKSGLEKHIAAMHQ